MRLLKKVLVGTLFCLLCYSSQAMALDLYGFGSYWDRSDVEGSYGAGLGVSLPFIIDHLRLDGRMYFFESSDIGVNDNLKVTPFDLGAQLHILPGGSFDPYVLAGVSYNYVDTDWADLDSTFGGYLGAGLDMNLGTSLFKLFGEVIYRISDLDNARGEDVDVGGFTGNVGLKFHF